MHAADPPHASGAGGGAYLRVLGGLALEPTDLQRPKPLLLLAYLCLEGAKDRGRLCELFYPDTMDPRAGLRVALRHVRRAAEGAVVSRGETLQAAVRSDASDLLVAYGQHDDERVLALYRGPFLAGLATAGVSGELEEWILGARQRLAHTARSALLRRAEALARQGEVAAAADLAERAYQIDEAPALDYDRLRPVYRLLRAGGSSLAPKLREEIDELGLPLRASSDARGTAPSHASGVGLDGPTSNNLPPATTSFIGRSRELADLHDALDAPHHRMVTLLGPGGMGKTRLALELARSQIERGTWDGVYFVELDHIAEPSGVVEAIGRAMSHRLGDEAPLEELLEVLASRHVLLVLDNFDHLVGRSDVPSVLLQGCPNVRLVVTSRERLHVAGEATYPLVGLPLAAAGKGSSPGSERLPPSVELFVQRARSADLRFDADRSTMAAIGEICRLVDGAPLGIELAAAWARAMAVTDLAERMREDLDTLVSPRRDVPPRHRSLRAAFETSWQQLEPREQVAYARLSVFRGGFRQQDAALVADAPVSVLATLIDKSLLRISPAGRYDRHALLYQFAQEKLASDPDQQRTFEMRHAEHFVHLAEEAEPMLRTSSQQEWLGRLDEEMANVRAALSVLLGEPVEDPVRSDQVELALRLTGALGHFWYVRSAFTEGRQWLDRALSLPRPPNERLVAKALHAAGRLARSQGDFAMATVLLTEALELAGRDGGVDLVIECHNELGIVAAGGAHYATAIEHFKNALELSSTSSSQMGLEKILNNLGLLYTIQGRLDDAQALNERGLAAGRARGDDRNVSHALNNLALVARRRGANADAVALYDQSIAIADRLRDPYLTAEAHLGKGVAVHLAGDPTRACSLVRRSLELFLAQDDRLGVIDALGETASLAVALDEPALALRLWAVLGDVRSHLRFPMQPFARERYERDVRRVLQGGTEVLGTMSTGEPAQWSLDEATERAMEWLAVDRLRGDNGTITPAS